MTATAASTPAPKTLTRAIRVEVVKPLDRTWDDVGPTLRTLQSVIHRFYTASALAAIETDRRNRKGDTASAHPQTAAYRIIEEELDELRQWAQAKLDKLKNTKPKKHKKAEDAEKSARDRQRQIDALTRIAELRLPGGMKAAISATAFAGFKKWRKDKGNNRVPTWKQGAPIPSRAQESSLDLDGQGIVLTVKLTPSGQDRFVVRSGPGVQWAALRKLASAEDPTYKLGEVRLKRATDRKDKSGRKKWFAFISYTCPAPEKPSVCRSDNTMIIHRGERNLLVCATNEGKYLVLASGNKLRAQKRALKARRESLQARSKAERGQGSGGHGRTRRYEVTEALSQKEKRVVHTLCQQLGARVAQLAVEWGCGSIYIEKFGGIEADSDRGKRMVLERFPYYELKTSIEWALKKRGLDLAEYDHEYISQTCPACSEVNAKAVNRFGTFHCKACAFDRPVDFIAAIHALRRVCGDAGDWEGRILAAERLRGK